MTQNGDEKKPELILEAERRGYRPIEGEDGDWAYVHAPGDVRFLPGWVIEFVDKIMAPIKMMNQTMIIPLCEECWDRDEMTERTIRGTYYWYCRRCDRKQEK